MFQLSESVPANFPGTTITGRTGGPVVWATHKVANVDAALVALNSVEFWECVRTGLPLLSESQRDDLVRLAGGVTEADAQLVVDRAEQAETDLEAARADLDGLAMQIAAKVMDNVIDLDAERAKRRPEPATAA